MHLCEEIEILSRTIYGEARGEYTKQEGGLAALIAVANVIMNRVKLKSWFGKNIAEVCQKPWQFSCWNKNDVNYSLLMKEKIHDPIYEVCREVAEGVVFKNWPDLTKGADHYHSLKMQTFPKWTEIHRPKTKFGDHLFYQLGG